MIPTIPWYITLVTLATSVALAAGAWYLVAAGADRAGLPSEAARRVRVATAGVIGLWLGLALLLAPAPGTLPGGSAFALNPLIPIFGLGSAAVVLLARSVSSSFRRALGAMPLPALHGIQLFRVIGAVFIVLLGLGQLPAHFAVPAGWGDVAVGLAAPVVAFALATRRPGARALAAGWNVFGLLDLVVAVGMGTGYLAPLLAPELGRVPPVPAMGAFPLIVVPTFAVPLAIMLHVAGLGRLLGERRAASRLVAHAAR
jgi:hypothetical protein